MRRLPIGSRLALAFALIVLLTLAAGAVGFWQLMQVRQQAHRLQQVDAEALAILRVNNSVLKLKDELQQLAQTQEPVRFSQEANKLSGEVTESVEQAVEILSASPAKNQETRYAAQLRQLADIGTLSSQVDLMTDLAEADDWLAVQLRLENQVQQVSQITQDLVQEVDHLVTAERELLLNNMEQAQQQAFATWLIASVLTLVAAGILGLVVTRSITQPLSRLEAGAKALMRHKFDHSIEITGDDELANLSQAFNDAASQLAERYTSMEDMIREHLEELQHRAMQLEISLAVTQRVTSILDLDTLLDQVVELIRKQYGYDYVGVFLLDESGDYVVARAGTGEAGHTLRRQGYRLKVGHDGIVGWVARHRRLERVDDVAVDNRHTKLELVPNTRSELALPLTIGKTMFGVLDIQSDQIQAFRLDDLPVLQSLANQVAIAIQNASLYQGEQSRRRLAEMLYHAGRAISSTLDLTDVLNLILEHLATIVPYDRAAIMLRSKNELEFMAARGFPAEMDPLQLRVSIRENDVFEQIYYTHEPLVIADVLERPDWQHLPGLPAARSWLGVPLTRFDKVIGMFSLARETVSPYQDDEVTLAATFAGQAAFALENARLYDKITRFTQQLEDMVRERTEALQEAYTQLEHLDRAKSDFINITAHELRTPITVLQGYSRMLIGDPQIQQNSIQLDLLTSIHSGAVRLHQVVNSMLDMAKIDNRALELYPEPVFVPSVIELVLQKFGETLLERNLKLTLEEMSQLPSIEVDPDALYKVFYHLIVNAIKFTPDGGTIMISGRARQSDWDEVALEGIEIVVSDTGIGIDAEYRELVFAKFYQTGELALHSSGQTKFKGAGPGLGLAIVRGIVEAHHGRVWAESPGYDEETCPGSRFYVFLPLRQEGQPKKYQGETPSGKAKYVETSA